MSMKKLLLAGVALAAVTAMIGSANAQYVLGMTVRDGRWEVQSLNSAPALSN